ncbi:MAG TPA: hypothetical protein VFI44_04620 [Ornithinibacter sp.]|nr:hypothetical protein [Ornithinibacter sp.]
MHGTAPLNPSRHPVACEDAGVACVGSGWSAAQYARSALRQRLECIGMAVVEGAALHLAKTIDLDGTVHADDADVADVGRVDAGLVAARTAAEAASTGR